MSDSSTRAALGKSKRDLSRDLNRDGIVDASDDPSRDLDHNGIIDSADRQERDMNHDHIIDGSDQVAQGNVGAVMGLSDDETVSRRRKLIQEGAVAAVPKKKVQ